MRVVATDLEIPWDIAFLPNDDMLVTERAGKLLRVTQEGKKKTIHTFKTVTRGEGGLLGITLHPNFVENGFVYVYYTYASAKDGKTKNKVERYVLKNDRLTNPLTIIEDIPGAIYHDGGRIAFGPNGYLYITTGDAGDPQSAQDTQSLAGKILRILSDGTITDENIFGNAVYSYGHRNAQGLTWDDNGILWSTEHGRSGFTSGLDEINRIALGGNYGWPDSQGNTTLGGTVSPILHSGKDTWAPASATYYNGSIFFGGLRGEALYEAELSNGEVSKLHRHDLGLGRIRTTVLHNDVLYITTSNRDGRGRVRTDDDQIIALTIIENN